VNLGGIRLKEKNEQYKRLSTSSDARNKHLISLRHSCDWEFARPITARVTRHNWTRNCAWKCGAENAHKSRWCWRLYKTFNCVINK